MSTWMANESTRCSCSSATTPTTEPSRRAVATRCRRANSICAWCAGDRAGHAGLTACEGSTLLGYAHITELNAGEGWSIELAVRPGRRGHGVGTELFAAAVDDACGRGGGPINLWVYGDSAPARALARRF